MAKDVFGADITGLILVLRPFSDVSVLADELPEQVSLFTLQIELGVLLNEEIQKWIKHQVQSCKSSPQHQFMQGYHRVWIEIDSVGFRGRK